MRPAAKKQAPSAAVAAAVRRAQRDSLLRIKAGSLWAVATTTSAYLDSLLSALEDLEHDEIFPCAKAFVSHARAVAALANDFEAVRKAIAGSQGGWR